MGEGARKSGTALGAREKAWRAVLVLAVAGALALAVALPSLIAVQQP
ncbi:hypothetical protein OG897_01770 [Streptomyces sp. NBC_00237]|nr:hypothetical protein [Streptomyces sp. NBC_00237]MCX5200194.1 hypothetical protein [Streptomyces sp. NBC_00237]